MKSLLPFLVLVTLVSCHDDPHVSLNAFNELEFSGTFETIRSDNVSGLANLSISNGHYESTTNLPFGYGAGKIEVSGNTVNFIDTAFFNTPAIFGPAYPLSGKHAYTFDGQHLIIWRKKNLGSIVYNLEVDN